MTDLHDAIAEVRRLADGEFNAEIPAMPRYAQTILNAVASGALVPATDAEALAGAVLQEAAGLLNKRIDQLVADYGSYEYDTNVTNLPEWVETAAEELEPMAAAILALRPEAHEALARALQRAREVKPLVWTDYPDESVAEPYQIEARGSFWRAYVLTGYESADTILTPDGGTDHPTLEAAKAATQADYAARITAALQPGDGQ